MTTRAPPALCTTPSSLPCSMKSIAVGLGGIHRHHHALARGQAIGLDHDRRAHGVNIGVGGSDIGIGKVSYCAVGIPWRFMKALENALELSSCAAAGSARRRAGVRAEFVHHAGPGRLRPTTVSTIFSAMANPAARRSP